MPKEDKILVIITITVLFLLCLASTLLPKHKTNEIKKEENVVNIATKPINHINNDIINLSDVEIKMSIQQKRVIARVTAYAPFDNKSGICADDNPFVTSIGHYPSKKYVAVNPELIPYGTKMYISGYGFVEAGDTGGALRSYDGYAIDVFMRTYKEAISEWGVRYIDVIIYN